MNLSEFTADILARCRHGGPAINETDVRHVLGIAFDTLQGCTPAEALQVLAEALRPGTWPAARSSASTGHAASHTAN